MKITKKDQRMQRIARNLLRLSDHPKYQMAAVLAKAGNVIAVGVNKHNQAAKSFTHKLDYPIALHAEVDCLNNIWREKTKGATIYVVGQTVSGTRILTKPCPSCHDFIEKMGVRKVVFENQFGELEKIKL